MKKLPIALSIVFALGAPGAASSQDLNWVETKFESLDQSLEQLLNDGYSVVSGQISTTLMLQDEKQEKFVVCAVKGSPFDGGGGPSESLCFSLN